MIITGVAEADGGWRLRSTDRQPDLWGLEHGPARDFVRARLSDFTIRCFEQPLDAPTHAATTLNRTYLACVRDGYPAQGVVRAVRQTRSRRVGVPRAAAGHDCHVELPEVVSGLLLKAAM
jgi:hypothetical protein